MTTLRTLTIYLKTLFQVEKWLGGWTGTQNVKKSLYFILNVLIRFFKQLFKKASLSQLSYI
jgi:hypothetical protein